MGRRHYTGVSVAHKKICLSTQNLKRKEKYKNPFLVKACQMTLSNKLDQTFQHGLPIQETQMYEYYVS